MAPLPLSAVARVSHALLSSSLRPRAAETPASPRSEPRAAGPPTLAIPHLRPRQSEAPYVTETYGSVDDSPSPGEIVGIVIGSIAGFLLLLWLVHICIHNAKPAAVWDGTIASTSGSSLLTHRHRHSSKSHSSRSHSHRHSHGSHRKSGVRRRETVEIRTSNQHHPIIIDEPRHRHSAPPMVEVENRRRSSGKPVIVPVAASEPTTLSTATEDIIVVQPPPAARRHSKRNSGHSHHRRHSSGYRDIHPDQFAGGIEPVRDVRRSRGR